MINYKKICCFLCLLMIMFTSFMIAQKAEFVDKTEFADKTLGGECVIKSSKISVHGETSMKVFEIEVAEEDDYYLSAWMMKTGIIEKNNGLKFYIDDEKIPAGIIKPTKESWQSAKLLDDTNAKSKKLKLTAGKHSIAFCSTIPEIPPVEFIRISKNEPDAEIPEDSWTNYFETAKNNISKSAKDSSDNDKLSKVNEDPKYLYEHQLNQYYTYTYFALLYLNVGSIELETRKADPYTSNPVMYLFNYQNPDSFSVFDDNSGLGYQSLIIAQIPTSGTYCVLVRSSSSNQSQTSDLYLNSNLYASNIVISGASLSCSQTLTEQLNYFTSHPTGDPMLFLQRNDNKIRAYNDDYTGSGDFVWQQNSRVKYTLISGQSITKCILTSSSTYYPTGYCDLYMGCRNRYIPGHSFQYLEEDDAMVSGKHTDPYIEYFEQPDYNCIAWTGGMTSSHCWPPDASSDYYVRDDSLQSFDNFYGNYPVQRYSGAWTYIRTTTAANSLIDLCWSGSTFYFGHATINARWVNNPTPMKANDFAHGYDWESKDSEWERFFHPRYALTNEYPVAFYYTISSLAKSSSPQVNTEYISEEESIKRGLSIVDRVELTDDELIKIAELKKKLLSEFEINEFNDKYETWKNTWSDMSKCLGSSPRSHAQSDEYYNFLNYCISKGKKVLPLILEKVNNENLFYVTVPLNDLTYKGNETLMEEVKNENSKNRYTKEGVFIIYTQHGNWIKYGKKLLSKFDQFKGFTPGIETDKLNNNVDTLSEELIVKNYPNPFNPSINISYTIPSNNKISIKIYDVLGKEVTILIDNEFQSAGWHNIKWNGNDINGQPVSSGIYFGRIIFNNQAQTVKLMLIR